MKRTMLSLAVLLVFVSAVRAQTLDEAQKQLLLLKSESTRLEEAARAMSEMPAEFGGTLIAVFPGPQVEVANPTATQLAALLSERKAYWTKRKSEIQSDSYEFWASTGMAEREVRLVEAVLADIAADKAALAAKSFGQPLIDRKTVLVKDWLEFLRFKRGCLLGLEPLDAGKAPTRPKRAWCKPTAISGFGGAYFSRACGLDSVQAAAVMRARRS